MKSSFLLLIILVLLHQTHQSIVWCLGTNALSQEVDCTDLPVCETTCDFVFEDKVGTCYGKKIHFKITNETEYKDVCIYKNYGNDDDVNFSKEIIEKETGIKVDVEKTDIFQEYSYRLKKQRMLKYCNEVKNGKDVYQRELDNLNSDFNSTERLERMERLKNSGQLPILERLYFFITNTACKCSAFAQYYAEKDPAKYELYKNMVVSECQKQYPDCKDMPNKKLPNESDDEFLHRRGGLQHVTNLAKTKFEYNNEQRGIIVVGAGKNHQDQVYYQEQLEMCNRNQGQCQKRSYERFAKNYNDFLVRYEDLVAKIPALKTGSFYVDNPVFVRKMLNERVTAMQVCRTVWPGFCRSKQYDRVRRICTGLLKRYKFPVIIRKRVCKWDFNYKNCIQNYCYEDVELSMGPSLVGKKFFSNEVEISKNEVCENSGVYETIRYYQNLGSNPNGCQVYYNYTVYVNQRPSTPFISNIAADLNKMLNVTDRAQDDFIRCSTSKSKNTLQNVNITIRNDANCLTFIEYSNLVYLNTTDGFNYFKVGNTRRVSTAKNGKCGFLGIFESGLVYPNILNQKFSEKMDKLSDVVPGVFWDIGYENLSGDVKKCISLTKANLDSLKKEATLFFSQLRKYYNNANRRVKKIVEEAYLGWKNVLFDYYKKECERVGVVVSQNTLEILENSEDNEEETIDIEEST